MIADTLVVITARSEEFSKLDAALGDGDHGEAIVSALKVMQVDSLKGNNFKTILGDMGFGVMLQTSGSTSTLLGGFMLGMSDNVAVDVTEVDSAQVKQMFKGGLEGVRKNTQAQRGDKTIIDALEPAVDAMESCDSQDCVELFAVAAAAALEGAQSTKSMKAEFGRARNLGDKTIGHIDAGALSWATIIDTFYKSLKGDI